MQVQDFENELRRKEDLKFLEEDVPRLKESDLETAARNYKAKTGVQSDGFRPNVPLDLE